MTNNIAEAKYPRLDAMFSAFYQQILAIKLRVLQVKNDRESCRVGREEPEGTSEDLTVLQGI